WRSLRCEVARSGFRSGGFLFLGSAGMGFSAAGFDSAAAVGGFLRPRPPRVPRRPLVFGSVVAPSPAGAASTVTGPPGTGAAASIGAWLAAFLRRNQRERNLLRG